MDIEQEIVVLKRQVLALRNRSRDLSEFVNCYESPIWKKVWWWFGGFYIRKVGRWYDYDSFAYKAWSRLAKLIHLPL